MWRRSGLARLAGLFAALAARGSFAKRREVSLVGGAEQRGARAGALNQTLISSRFGQFPETEARELFTALKELGLNPKIVTATVGEDYGETTVRLLETSKAMVVMASKNYGQRTGSYSTYYELKYAFEHGLMILPVQLSRTFPPEPPGDPRGAELCKWAMGPSMKRIDWSGKPWDARLVAEELRDGIEVAYGMREPALAELAQPRPDLPSLNRQDAPVLDG
uniref:TIR domain-containing protein n=1 Tax=Alexandrium catenella TaxID=2925 RepID=A0A7S1S4N0_ALECA